MLADLRLAARSLARVPGATALQLATIAIGVGGLSAVFAVVSGIVLKPLPFDDAATLATIEVTSSRGFSISNSIPNLRDWRDRSRSFESTGGFAGWTFRLQHADGSEILNGATVFGDLFGVLRTRAALGRLLSAAETEPGSPPLAVLSHSLWQRAFGADSAVVGSTINLDGMPYSVVGVLPRGFAFPRTEPAVIANMGSIAGLPWNERSSSFGTRMFARLRAGATFESAAADLERIGADVKAENGPTTALPSLVGLDDYLVGNNDRALYLLLAAVGIVMLIAVGNAGSLVLARAADRRRDTAVRLALGGQRADLRTLHIHENLVLALAGGTIGLVMAVLLVRALVPMLPDDLPESLISRIAIDLPTVATTLVVCAGFGLLFGLTAAAHSMPNRLHDALRSGTKSIVAPRTRARAALLIGETALSLMLAVGAGLLLSSFYRLRTVDKGFTDDGILTARITPTAGATSSPALWLAYNNRLIDAARAIPGVTHVAAALNLPLTNRSNELRVQPFGSVEPVIQGPSVQYNLVSTDFFEAMSIPVVAGRLFTESDNNNAEPVAIIDASMARQFWPGQDPIGQRVTINEVGADSMLIYRTVVGVVSNVRHYTLREPARIQIYVPMQGALARSRGSLTMVVRGALRPNDFAAPLRRAMLSVDAGATVWNVRPLTEYVDASISTERTLGVITTWLAMVASLVTAVGLFALVTYAVGQRRREIALRLAMGATPGDVVGLMTWSGTSMSLVGIGIGTLGAFALTRLLTGFLFEVGTLDPLVYISAALTLLAITLIASLIPALRARHLAPAAVLRED